MTLHFNTPKDTVADTLRQRISQQLIDHEELKRGTPSYPALPHTIDKRALPLAQLAFDRFAPKLEKGPIALKSELKAMAKPGSSLGRAFRDHIEKHPADYPIRFYEHLFDEHHYHTGYTAERMADRLTLDLCNALEPSMIVTDISAAPVTAITPQAKALAAQIASKEAGRAA